MASDEGNKLNWDLPSIPLMLALGGSGRTTSRRRLTSCLDPMRHGTYTQKQRVLHLERTPSWFNIAVTMYILKRICKVCSREFEVILNIHILGVCMCKCQWSQRSKDLPPAPGAGVHCPPSHPTSFTELLYHTFRTHLALLESGVCKEQHSELLERSPLQSLAMTGQLKTIGPLHAKGQANQDTVSNPLRTVL